MICFTEDDFFQKISITFLLLNDPFSKISLMSMACWENFLSQLHFVSMEIPIVSENTVNTTEISSSSL